MELTTHIPVHQCKTARTNCVFFLFSGICSFFFFTGKIKIAEDAAPSLNYYWVPILVSKLEFYQSSNTRFSICKIFNFPGCNNLLSLHLQTVVFGAYLIAHGFFSVYAMCVDTLFLCFCKCEAALFISGDNT